MCFIQSFVFCQISNPLGFSPFSFFDRGEKRIGKSLYIVGFLFSHPFSVLLCLFSLLSKKWFYSHFYLIAYPNHSHKLHRQSTKKNFSYAVRIQFTQKFAIWRWIVFVGLESQCMPYKELYSQPFIAFFTFRVLSFCFIVQREETKTCGGKGLAVFNVLE